MKRDGFEAPASLSLLLEIKDIRKGVLFNYLILNETSAFCRKKKLVV